jgi:ABC-type glycerol-3-phosphate transport system permease component
MGPPVESGQHAGRVMVVPVIILVMFSQKAIVRGLTRGAIK